MNIKKIKDAKQLVMQPQGYNNFDDKLAVLEGILGSPVNKVIVGESVFVPRAMDETEIEIYEETTGVELPEFLKERAGWVYIGDSYEVNPYNTETLILSINSLLAEEFQAWYQYFVAAPFLIGNERASIQEFFIKSAEDELNDHAVKLINRLNELRSPCLLTTPDSWKEYAQAQFLTAPTDVVSQLNINREAETKAIEHYQAVIEVSEIIKDYVTADILKKILADEEQHLAEINDFLNDLEV